VAIFTSRFIYTVAFAHYSPHFCDCTVIALAETLFLQIIFVKLSGERHSWVVHTCAVLACRMPFDALSRDFFLSFREHVISWRGGGID
jgi:hypothetical protein